MYKPYMSIGSPEATNPKSLQTKKAKPKKFCLSTDRCAVHQFSKSDSGERIESSWRGALGSRSRVYKPYMSIGSPEATNPKSLQTKKAKPKKFCLSIDRCAIQQFSKSDSGERIESSWRGALGSRSGVYKPYMSIGSPEATKPGRLNIRRYKKRQDHRVLPFY